MGEDVELGPQTIAWKERITCSLRAWRGYICER